MRSLPWLDLVVPEPAQLVAAADAVEAAASRGPVLVCCALGYSRSAAVAVVWLCIHGPRLAVPDALRAVRAARPQIVLHAGWLDAIEAAVQSARRSA